MFLQPNLLAGHPAQLLPGFHAQPVGVSPYACAPAPAFDCSPSPLLNPFGPLIQPLGATMAQLLEYNQHHMRSGLCLVLRVAAAEMTFKCGELERVALESVAGFKERVAHEAGLKTRVRQAEAQLRKAEAATAAHAARIEEYRAAAAQQAEAAAASHHEQKCKRQRLYTERHRTLTVPEENIVPKASSREVKDVAVAIRAAVPGRFAGTSNASVLQFQGGSRARRTICTAGAVHCYILFYTIQAMRAVSTPTPIYTTERARVIMGGDPSIGLKCQLYI